MVKLLKRKRHHILNFMIMLACGLATFYVFAASYETVFNQDLPLVQAVNTVNLAPVSRVLGNYKSVNQTALGNYGVPRHIKLPSQNVKITTAPGIEVGGNYLARTAAAHYFVTSDAKDGNIGDLVMYFEKSWRTNDEPEKIKSGDNLFLDTDRDWRYFYRIESVNTLNESEQYVSRNSNANKLVLLIANRSAGQVVVAQATLINVQSVGL